MRPRQRHSLPERAFEPISRVDRSRSRDTGGSGPGLAIVRSAIETWCGEAIASLTGSGGRRVTSRLPKHPPGGPGEV